MRMIDLVGQQFGHYRLERLLGSGGFADVYLGKHIHLDSPAAIKVLHTRLSHADIELFRVEARNLVRLIHPHIVRLLDFGLEDNTPYLVMDYVPNGSLRDRYPRGSRLSLSTIIPYVKQIAEALQYAHDQKLIHRDVKPENMLLGYNGEAVLSDFGVAVMAHTTNSIHTEEAIGTVSYMAPEQIQGKPRPASDQYSLGIVIYTWLTGTLPFTGTYAEVAMQHLTQSPPPLSKILADIPQVVEQVVLRSLEKDYRQRFPNVQVFVQELMQVSQIWKAPAISSINLPSAKELPEAVQKAKKQWIEEGNKYRQSKKFKEAIIAYSNAIRLDSYYALAYNNRGYAHLQLGGYQKALDDFNNAILLEPKKANFYNNRGLAYERLKRYQLAIDDYDRALSLEPNHAFAYENREIARYMLKHK